MLPDYKYKLISEGRWINYILFFYLKDFPPHLAIFINFICLFYFIFTCCYRFTKEVVFTILFSLVAIELPSFYSFIGWSVTFLPTFLILAFLTWLSKYVDYKFLYVLGSTLFFGGLNNFYNLLPLLYLSQIKNQDNKEYIKSIFWWVLSYFFGYFFMLVMLKTLSGNFELIIGTWRKPNPVHDLDSLIFNLKRVGKDLLSHISIVGNYLYACVILFITIKIFKYKDATLTKISLTLVLVMMACYAQSLPMGLGVGTRTAVAFFISFIFLYLVIKKFSTTLTLCFFIPLLLMEFITHSHHVS